jgi:hypothetical protein
MIAIIDWPVTNVSICSSKCCLFPAYLSEWLELWAGPNISLEEVGNAGDKMLLIYEKHMSVKVAPNSRTVTLYYNFQLIELILGY